MKSPEQIYDEKKIMIDDLLKGNGKQIIVDAIRAGMEEGIIASADLCDESEGRISEHMSEILKLLKQIK